MSDAVVMRDVLVVGGGCYGRFYAAQLAKAQARGKARFRRVIVVDRDGQCRARRELGEAPDRAFVIAEWQARGGGFLHPPPPPPPGRPRAQIAPAPPHPPPLSPRVPA